MEGMSRPKHGKHHWWQKPNWVTPIVSTAITALAIVGSSYANSQSTQRFYVSTTATPTATPMTTTTTPAESIVPSTSTSTTEPAHLPVGPAITGVLGTNSDPSSGGDEILVNCAEHPNRTVTVYVVDAQAGRGKLPIRLCDRS